MILVIRVRVPDDTVIPYSADGVSNLLCRVRGRVIDSEVLEVREVPADKFDSPHFHGCHGNH
jgi:hypothetical protein